MRKRGRAARAAGCGAALAAILAAGARAEGLGDAISLAYETNPQLQAERAQLRATDEEYPQAEAGLRPTLGASGSYTYQSQRVSAPGVPAVQVAGGTGTALVQLSQPLYTGGRATARIDAARADILAERESLHRTEISVLQSVVGAYLDVRRDAEQLRIARDNVAVLARQLEETSARFEAGQLTRTDVAQSEARLAQAKAQAAGAQATLGEARAAYKAAVGQEPGELAPEPDIDARLPASVEAAFDAAERASPQLRQAEMQEEASAARLAEAKAQTRPTVSLTGQYGYAGAQQGFSSGLGSGPGGLQQEVGGSVAVQATTSLFAGGLYQSQVRQAAAQDDVAEIGVETARRQVLQSVANAWSQLLGARAALTADAQQVRSDEVAFQGVKAEQQVGLRTVLDVLNAQQELETSQLALVGARHDAYVAEAAVLAAAGALDARDFAPAERAYDPKANFDRVRHAPGWTPWDGAVAGLDRLGAPAPPAR